MGGISGLVGHVPALANPSHHITLRSYVRHLGRYKKKKKKLPKKPIQKSEGLEN